MKVCFPVNHDKGLEGLIYGHFGRAPKFIIVDTETGSTQMIENDHFHHHGAHNIFSVFADFNVNAVVVWGIGEGAYNKLTNYSIKVYEAVKGTAAFNLEKFKSGELVMTDDSSSYIHVHHHGHEHHHNDLQQFHPFNKN